MTEAYFVSWSSFTLHKLQQVWAPWTSEDYRYCKSICICRGRIICETWFLYHLWSNAHKQNKKNLLQQSQLCKTHFGKIWWIYVCWKSWAQEFLTWPVLRYSKNPKGTQNSFTYFYLSNSYRQSMFSTSFDSLVLMVQFSPHLWSCNLAGMAFFSLHLWHLIFGTAFPTLTVIHIWLVVSLCREKLPVFFFFFFFPDLKKAILIQPVGMTLVNRCSKFLYSFVQMQICCQKKKKAK